MKGDNNTMYKPTKKSPRYFACHHQDIFTDLGFDYRGHIFEKTISPEILKNSNNKSILGNIENMVLMLIDTVKQIKTFFMISIDKNDRNVN